MHISFKARYKGVGMMEDAFCEIWFQTGTGRSPYLFGHHGECPLWQGPFQRPADQSLRPCSKVTRRHFGRQVEASVIKDEQFGRKMVIISSGGAYELLQLDVTVLPLVGYILPNYLDSLRAGRESSL